MPALLGLKGNLEMAGIKAFHRSECPGWRWGTQRLQAPQSLTRSGHCRPFSAAQVRKVGPGWKGSGDPGLVVPAPGQSSLLSVVPRLGFWESQPPWTLAHTPCFAARLVTVCAASPGEHHAGPFTCTAGAFSDLQPCSAAGPEQSQAFPAPPPRSLSPTAACSSVRGIEEEGRLILPPPQPLRSAVVVRRLNQIQGHGAGEVGSSKTWEARARWQGCPRMAMSREGSRRSGLLALPILPSWPAPSLPQSFPETLPWPLSCTSS